MSDSSSPPRKRQRMSSPTYDEQLALPSQDELRVIEQLEHGLSQAASQYRNRTSKVPISSQDNSGHESPHRVSDYSDQPIPSPFPVLLPQQNLAVDHNNSNDPFMATSGPFTGFTSASTIRYQQPSITPVETDLEGDQNEGESAREPVRDPSSISFTSASDLMTSSACFTSASALAVKPVTHHDLSFPLPVKALDDYAQTVAESNSFGLLADNASNNPFSAFTSLGKQKNLFQPSAAAMRKAQERAKRWAAEDDDLSVDLQDDTPEQIADVTTSARQVLQTVENVSHRGMSIGPIASASAMVQVEASGAFRSAAYFSTPSVVGSRSAQMPSGLRIEGNAATKPFKSPLLDPAASRNTVTPQRIQPLCNNVAFTPTREPKPAGSFIGEVHASGSRFSTPMRVEGTPMRKVATKKFVTPFKPGMRPGEPGHEQLKARHDTERVNAVAGPSTEGTLSMGDGCRKLTRRFFDLTVRYRKTLASSGFQPGTRGLEALAKLGINVDELCDLSPKSALQHRFHVSAQGIPPTLQGPIDALRELKGAGCHLATQEWVDNHWSLILWKLGGMAALDPERETDVKRRRWSWAETMRQLRYRYEKELNRGARPALRLIAAQDVSAGLHTILCVSDIVWPESGVGDDGLPLVPHPMLELTDGWYRLRAQVDDVLARAARRGVIRVGRKISVSGASLPRNTEPCEILEAYDKVELNISGNGTHLAPWHAKLGFQPCPSIATLHTLSPEGGIVPCLQLIVTKEWVYPIAFIEFRKDSDGKITREGPRREKEEMAAHDTWLRNREREYQRLQKEADDKRKLFLDWAHRFEAKAGSSWHPRDDEDMPEEIESMFDECEYACDASSVLRRASRTEAGWLARIARERAEQEREALEVGLERELQSTCPPREVRNFCVVLMRDNDAHATRRPALRVVELTVWDVLSLTFDGGPIGQFKEGQTFQVTNLLPTQKNAWMDRSVEGAHVYLSTSKTSRWIKL